MPRQRSPKSTSPGQSKKLSSFRSELVALHREMYRRNERRIHLAVGDGGPEVAAYQQRYRRSLPAPRRVVTNKELRQRVAKHSVILLGDYHTLPQSQRSMLRLIRDLPDDGRPRALAVEFVETAHQKDLDDYLGGRIGEKTFLRRIAYRKHWPYGNFDGLRPLCELAQQTDLPMIAIDRDAGSGASLERRDAHAARCMLRWLRANPQGQIFCLIGELHLAPAHLPTALRKQNKGPLKILTLHQNTERVYHVLQSKGLENEADVVELTRSRYGLNVVPPLVCQQSFLRWLDADDQHQDSDQLREAFRDQLCMIAELLEIDPRGALSKVQVESFRDLSFLDRLQRSKKFTRDEIELIREQIANSESYYIPRLKLVYLGTPSVNHSSEEAAHYLRDVCAGQGRPRHAIEAFYDRAVNEALAFFGSKLVNHKRKALHVAAFRRMLASKDSDPVERALAEMVISHKRLERGTRRAREIAIFNAPPRILDALAHALGYMLGDRIYYGVVRGVVSRPAIRAVFMDPLQERGAAIATYFSLCSHVSGIRVPRRV